MTVSAFVYYTPHFRTRTGDNPRGRIKNLVDFANMCYTNSKVPARLRLFCTEEIDVPENNDRLHLFRDFKGEYNERNWDFELALPPQ